MRMAVLLYSETEGIKKKSSIIRRLIEAVFVELDNIEMGSKEIQAQVMTLFNVHVNEDEILEVLENNKMRSYFEKKLINHEMKYSISLKRYLRLKAESKKNIEDYIDEFIKTYGYDCKIKGIIYKYIYRLFKHNIEDFSKILGGKMEVDENLEQDLTPDEMKIIRGFINWDLPEKNEAILALMGCSLEYSMLVGDNSYLYGTRLGTIFSNKIIYIDTNIIYYCLGVNGDEFRIANEMLLDKCKKAGQVLRISSITEKEFVNTLEHYIDEIKKYESTSVSKLYKKYINNKDVYFFYLEWKKTRKKFDSVEFFKKYIMSQYTEWLKKYKVIVDREMPFHLEDVDVQETITTYSEQIPYKGSVNYDAQNIYWIECLRKKEGIVSGFSDEKYFILSPHKALKRWDFDRKNKVPIVIAPELWMTLLTRFVARSEDDYKSFINFINIKVPSNEVITNKEFYIIVQAVQEITDDIQQQEDILDVLVENKFTYLDKQLNEELVAGEIYSKTKNEAEKILSEKVSDLEIKIEKLNGKITEMEEDKINITSNYKRDAVAEINKEREKNSDIYADEKLKNKRIISAIIILIVTSIAIWQGIDFFVLKNHNNLFWKIIEELVVKTPIETEKDNIFIGLSTFVGVTVVGGIDLHFLKYFYSDEVIDKYRNKQKKIFLKQINR